MFGRNEVVGRKMFKDRSDLLVTTIFPTLQGEGPFAGSPAIFLRMAKCNLACSFCDTYFDKGEWYSVHDVVQMIRDKVPEKYWDMPFTYSMGVVITGGEPFLQIDNLTRLVNILNDSFVWVQFETNGILPIPQGWEDKVDPWQTHIVCSPKCHETTLRYIKPHATILSWEYLYLKFVISADPTSPYHTIPDWALEWAEDSGCGQVFISPMNEYLAEPKAARQASVTNNSDLGIDERSIVNEVVSFWEPGLLDMAKNQANHEYAGKYCLANNLRLTLQQHLYVGAP